jgi:hypothetical protein
MTRLKLGDCTPLDDSWFMCGIREYVGKTGEIKEEYFLWLRLPSYGMEYSLAHDDYRWAQRVLTWRGNHGFGLISLPI